MSTFLTADAVAERWQCSPEHVTRMARSRQLRAMKSGRIWRFRLKDVEAYEAAHTSDAESETPQGSGLTRAYASQRPAIELSGTYAPVVKGPVPWRSEVIS